MGPEPHSNSDPSRARCRSSGKGTKEGEAVAFFEEDIPDMYPLDILTGNSYLWSSHADDRSDVKSECVGLLIGYEPDSGPDDEDESSNGSTGTFKEVSSGKKMT
jgi:hypothetical protein